MIYLLFALFLNFFSIVSSIDIVGNSGCSAPVCVFANANLRFGTGSENSVNTKGLFQQPFYYSRNSNAWFKLTYNNYPLDTAIGTGLTGPNWSKSTVVDLASINPTASSNDYSNFIVTSADSAKSTGYGKIIARRTYTVNNQRLILQNMFSLGFNDTFVKTITMIINDDSNTIQNAYIWVGTRDDYVGLTDSNFKTRGNLINSAFVPLTNTNQPSFAMTITNPTEGVLFYSETSGVNTVFQQCCAFSNVFNLLPHLSGITSVTNTDGSYAVVLPFGNITITANASITWYYAAGSISSLTSVVESVSVAQQADSTPSATPSSVASVSVSASGSVSLTTSRTSSPSNSVSSSGSKSSSRSVSSSQSSSPSISGSLSGSSTPSSSITPSNSISSSGSSSPSNSGTSSGSSSPTTSITSSNSISSSMSVSSSGSISSSISMTATYSITPTSSTALVAPIFTNQDSNLEEKKKVQTNIITGSTFGTVGGVGLIGLLIYVGFFRKNNDNTVICEICQERFAQNLIEDHRQNCLYADQPHHTTENNTQENNTQSINTQENNTQSINEIVLEDPQQSNKSETIIKTESQTENEQLESNDNKIICETHVDPIIQIDESVETTTDYRNELVKIEIPKSDNIIKHEVHIEPSFEILSTIMKEIVNLEKNLEPPKEIEKQEIFIETSSITMSEVIQKLYAESIREYMYELSTIQSTIQ